MNMIKRLISGLLNLVTLSVLFVGSCVGPGVMYLKSPWWFLEEVGPDDGARSFFVAFIAEDSEGGQQLHVIRHDGSDPEKYYSKMQYLMPKERLSYSWGPGEGSAKIYAKTEAEGSQLIQVFVKGDTPWSSLSEYRVADNKVYPLRHAHSVAWLLLGVILCPVLMILLADPIRRGIKRFMRIEPE